MVRKRTVFTYLLAIFLPNLPPAIPLELSFFLLLPSILSFPPIVSWSLLARLHRDASIIAPDHLPPDLYYVRKKPSISLSHYKLGFLLGAADNFLCPYLIVKTIIWLLI